LAQRSYRRRLQLLDARKGQREHLHINTCGVHGRDPPLAEIAQPFDELRVARRHPAAFDEAAIREGVERLAGALREPVS
jgi:hypothetical protein